MVWFVATALASPELAREISAYRELRLAHDAPTLEEQVYARALAGEVVSGIEFVDGVKAGKGWGVTVFELPVATVWRALNDDERRAEYTSVSVSRVVSGTPHTSGRRTFQYLPLPVVADRWWIVEQVHNEDLYTASGGRLWEMCWEDRTDPTLAVEALADAGGRGMPVEWTRGAWLLVALDPERTLVEYYSWSDPGGALPAGMASRFASGAVEELLRDMERLAATRHAGQDAPGYVLPDQSPL